MRRKERILILKRIPHKDNTFILDALGRESGRKHFILRAGQTPAGKRLRALSIPGIFLETEYTETKSGWPRILHLHLISDFPEIRNDIRKTAVFLFMLENIHQLIRHDSGPEIYDWLLACFKQMDREAYRPVFHLRFMNRLLDFLGIKPRPDKFGTFFDKGKYISDSMMTRLTPDYRSHDLFRRFLTGEPLKGRDERYRALLLTEKYIRFFYENYRLPKSLGVFKEIFDDE